MSQVNVVCPSCQTAGVGEVPEITFINSPPLSQAVLIHQRAYTCPKCLATSFYTIAGAQLAIGLELLVRDEPRVIVPNGPIKLPKLNN